MAHVFISYSRKDTPFVEKLERDLQSRGVATWRDANNIPGGEEWYQSIVTGLDASYAMLCVLSPNADLSRWVLREQLYGDQQGLLRVPVLPQKHKIPFHLIETQAVLCTDSEYGAALARLTAILGDAKDNYAKAEPVTVGDDSERNIKAYLDFLLAEAKADLRDALYVNLMGASEAGKIQAKPTSALSFGLDSFGGFDRLGLEQIQGEAFDKRGEDVPDARTPLRDMKRVVLLGEPGSGKTTTLLQLAVDLAREAQENSEKLPVFVPLRQYDGSTSFEDFVKAQMHTLQAQYDDLLNNGKLIFLLDALNEMPRKSTKGRDLVPDVRDYLRDKTNWIVSCRVRDYQEELSALDGTGKVRLKPLDPPRIYEVIQKQFNLLAQQYPDQVQASEGEQLWADMHGTADLLKAWQVHVDCGKPESFWSKQWDEYVKSENEKYYWDTPGYRDWRKMKEDKRQMLPLCRNPYMSNMICQLYARSKTLPDNRGALFAQFVDKLLEREHGASIAIGASWIDDSLIRRGLAQIAYAMGAETEMPHSQAMDILRAELPDIDHELLFRIAVSASLLDVGETVRFTHQLLQEYFAGEIMWSEIAKGVDPATYWKPDNWWQSNGREESLIILAGVHGNPEKVAQWVAPAQPLLAYQVLTESGISLDLEDIAPQTRHAIVNGANDKIGTVDPVGRAAAYRVLAYMNADNRPGIGLDDNGLPDMVWCEVPAGDFLYGANKETRSIDTDYAVSKYAVTNAQFQAFVDAGDGYNNPVWWTEAGLDWKGKRTAPDEYDNPDFNLPNHPRVNITWYEAYAFTQWLSAKLDCTINLPTEEQWEKAARGTEGRVFAWGDEWDERKCNNYVGSNSIAQTSAVGIFRSGESPYGALDMTGNVWEWCLTEYESGSNDVDGTNVRVLRGGSWFYDFSDYFRCGYRHSWGPLFRNSNFGFRLFRS